MYASTSQYQSQPQQQPHQYYAQRTNPTRQPQPKPKQPRQKLQCLVLGAAGAGKTSILRRYFYGQYEPDRVSTLGSDFYIGHVSLPVAPSNQNDSNESISLNDKEEKKSSHNSEATAMEANQNHSSSSTYHNNNNNTAAATTSLFHNQQSGHLPNNNNNSSLLPRQRQTNSKNNNDRALPNLNINLQLWDTPGRERYYFDKKKRHQNVTLTDNFFQKAHAVALVYDMTSSTSFTQLLRWYADLLEIQKNLDDSPNTPSTTTPAFPILIVGNKLDLYKEKQQQQNTPSARHRVVKQRDVMGFGINQNVTSNTVVEETNDNDSDETAKASGQTKQSQSQQQQHKQPRFRGQDFQYEYQVDHNQRNTNNNKTTTLSKFRRRHKKKSAEDKNHDKHHHHHHRHSHHSTPADHHTGGVFFLANRENWTTDNSYLDSLLNSEDASSPDRDMVLLWCMRNRLQHMECSAATGEGVPQAIESLTQLAMDYVNTNNAQQQQQQQQQQSPSGFRCGGNGMNHNNNNSNDKASSTMTTWGQQQRPPLSSSSNPEVMDFQQHYNNNDNMDKEPCCWCARPLPSLNENKSQFL